jgi:DNA-binding response OmpR family regulator
MHQDIWKKPRVCIIDDDPDLREIYSIVLKREGFDIFLAVDGKQGVETAKKERPDIIILDMNMPVMNGVEVLEALGSDPELKKIPVIVLSNIDSMETIKEVGKFDTHFYFIKAMTTPQKVVAHVREVLHNR